MLTTPHSSGRRSLSSVFTRSRRMRPPRSSRAPAIAGAYLRHGPHQGAQNSTRTGRRAERTRSSYSSSRSSIQSVTSRLPLFRGNGNGAAENNEPPRLHASSIAVSDGLHSYDVGHLPLDHPLDSSLQGDHRHRAAAASADHADLCDAVVRHVDELDVASIHLNGGPDLVQRRL